MGARWPCRVQQAPSCAVRGLSLVLLIAFVIGGGGGGGGGGWGGVYTGRGEGLGCSRRFKDEASDGFRLESRKRVMA